jgi:hypothetical protein
MEHFFPTDLEPLVKFFVKNHKLRTLLCLLVRIVVTLPGGPLTGQRPRSVEEFRGSKVDYRLIGGRRK